MCTRYYLELSPELRPFIEAAQSASLTDRMIAHLGKPLKISGEIRPSDMVPVIASNRSGNRGAFPMIWGYTLAGVKGPVVNVRMETAAGKPTWREGWMSHRCILPASWYYEWEHLPMPDGRVKTGRRYVIQPVGSRVTWLAGIYRIEEARGLKYPVCSVLTRAPAESVRHIHDRMPLMLPENRIGDWIRPDSRPEELFQWAVTDLVAEEG